MTPAIDIDSVQTLLWLFAFVVVSTVITGALAHYARRRDAALRDKKTTGATHGHDDADE